MDGSIRDDVDFEVEKYEACYDFSALRAKAIEYEERVSTDDGEDLHELDRHHSDMLQCIDRDFQSLATSLDYQSRSKEARGTRFLKVTTKVSHVLCTVKIQLSVRRAPEDAHSRRFFEAPDRHKSILDVGEEIALVYSKEYARGKYHAKYLHQRFMNVFALRMVRTLQSLERLSDAEMNFRTLCQFT